MTHADGICITESTGMLWFNTGTATFGNEREFQVLLGTGGVSHVLAPGDNS